MRVRLQLKQTADNLVPDATVLRGFSVSAEVDAVITHLREQVKVMAAKEKAQVERLRQQAAQQAKKKPSA